MSSVREVLEAKGRTVYSTRPDATVSDAIVEMCRVKVGALLVLEEELPVGIISERDLMIRVLLKRLDPEDTKVEAVMTRKVVCIPLDAAVEEAMAIMTNRRCRHLPVVVDKKVVGMLSIGDLVRWASRNQEFEIRMLHDYVEGRYPG